MREREFLEDSARQARGKSFAKGKYILISPIKLTLFGKIRQLALHLSLSLSPHLPRKNSHDVPATGSRENKWFMDTRKHVR